MYELWDKGFLLLCCLAMELMHKADPVIAVLFLVAVAMGAITSIWNALWLKSGSLLLLLVLSIWEPGFLLLVPICMYDLFLTSHIYFAVLLIPFSILAFPSLGLSIFTLLLIFITSAFLLKEKTTRHARLTKNHNSLRDNTAELTLRLENTNRELMLHQDEQVQTAKLQERNRIAREMHDNVGHLLSSAMLQLGALMTLPQAEQLREPLRTLKDTLSEGMNSIRESVHGLFDESLDLQDELSALVKKFSFCHATLDYDVDTNPDRRLKFTFLAIVKEALGNIAKHSNATSVLIAVREHPALYQLDIRDNGQNAAYSPGKTSGIGIANMMKRVSDLNGRILITTDNGFHIFISITKEGLK